MMTFGDYVRGKTIAIVGPAPAPYDQAAEIDAHDIVYRTSYGFSPSLDPTAGFGDHYVPSVFPAGTGTRVDMSFYNGAATRQIAYGLLDHVLADLDWAMTKHQMLNPVAVTNQRWVGNPPRVQQANQVTLMLWDLSSFEPADVTVFGADFYMGKVEDWYAAEYMPADWHRHADDPTESIGPGAFHDQEDQRVLIRDVRERRGWPNGDDRFIRALYTPPEEHEARMRAEQARHAKRPVTV